MGCASGEEAYSIAILLLEHAATITNVPKIQVFATDIDERGLEMARKGRYPDSIAEHISPERLDRFFIKQDGAYQVKREVRERCIFSNHSFIKDPPFSRLDLLCCRNVMIYLGSDLQEKLIPLFHYALRRNGYLFLGPSENISAHAGLFRSIDKKHRIFQRKESLPRPVVQFPLVDIANRPPPSSKQAHEDMRNLPKQLERIILQRFRPACVTVKENGDAVYFSGPISTYLEQPTGSPNSNVVNMAREGIRIPLRSTLHRAATSHERVQTPVAFMKTQVILTVEPLVELRDTNLYMITFEETVSGPPESAQAAGVGAEETILHLENELRGAREQSQTTLEELETTNEELQSANEEFQSTNEELETSKEELQSFNEELETVNSELSRKVAELDTANSDLQNLLNSTQIATVFLDMDARIKNFTPAAGAIFRLIPGDIGRPITDMAAIQLPKVNLVNDINEVLRTLEMRERPLTASRGQRYQMRILPYRTINNAIEGVVITFVNMTQIVEAEQRAVHAQLYADSVVETIHEPLIVLDIDLRVKSANQAFYDTFRVSEEATVGKVLYELGNRQWDSPDLRRLLNEVLPTNSLVKDFRVEHRFPGLGRRVMLLNAKKIGEDKERAPLILLSIEDITAR